MAFDRLLATAIIRLVCTSLAAWFLCASPASAAPFGQRLTPCVRAVTKGDNPDRLVSQAAAFDCTTKQQNLPAGDYWVRLDAFATSAPLSDPLYLRTTSVWLEGHEVHAYYSDGQIFRRSISKSQTSQHLMLGAMIEFPLAVHDAPLSAIMVKVENAANVRGIFLAPKLVSTSASARDERNLAAFYAGFAGLCLALLVYNLALWRGMRSPFQLAYGAMVVSLLAYAFTSSGAAAYAFPSLENQDRLRINYVLLSLSAATALIFLRHFLEDHIFPRWFVRAMWAQASLVMLTGVSFALIAPHAIAFLDFAYFTSFVALPLFFVGALWFGKKHRSRFTGYLLVAWSAPVAAAFARTLHGVGVIPYHFLLDNASLAAMAIEAMISSMAIGQRIRTISRERDLAKQSEIIARQLADTDALTGLLNRRAFVRDIMAQPGEWRLTLFDIDHFKWVNDTLGHDGGDEVLARFASLLAGLAPDDALVARLGGEEFAIATLADAACDAERLLAAVRATPMLDNYRITASCGSAQRLLAFENDWKLLYKAADTALYRAKSNGRDQHIAYQEARAAA
jgi:diguanylate cyclase (GGDEF)-like protein